MESERKTFPVFDADGHVNDPTEIWTRYVPAAERDLVRSAYWKDDNGAVLNGRQCVMGGARRDFDGLNPIAVGGPGMDRTLIRRLRQMRLTHDQRAYLDHAGTVDARARAADMDLMGIDQALILPTMLHAHLPFVRDPRGAAALCRAYNNWARDWCATVADRLFPAGLLPVQSATETVQELERIAALGFRVALIRPMRPPSRDASGGGLGSFDALYRTLEETGLVLGVHPLPIESPDGAATPRVAADLIARASADRYVNRATLSYMIDGMAWLAPVLLGGLLDRYPLLRVAILGCGASWLAPLLVYLDRLFALYRNERTTRSTRLPSQAFREQCVISFKSGEGSLLGREEEYREVAIWASDCYHADASDGWRAVHALRDAHVDDAVQATLLGANARRAYAIEAATFVAQPPGCIPRPAWFPTPDEIAAAWEREVHRRRWDGASLRRLCSRLMPARIRASLIALWRARS